MINKGSKILDGSVAQVKQDFKEHLFSVGIENADAVAGNDLFDVIGNKAGKVILRLRPSVTNNQVLKHFIQQDQQVQSFEEILPSLNDIFIKLVEGTPTARQFEQLSA